MITIDAIVLVATVVASTVGATYTIAKKLGGIEEKVNGLEKTVLEVKTELKADIDRLRLELKSDIKGLEGKTGRGEKFLTRPA